MGTLLCVILVICVILLIYSFLGLVRNDVVYNIKTHFLETDWDAYQRLPEYGEMLYNPKHYFRWTVKSWEKYVQQTKGE